MMALIVVVVDVPKLTPALLGSYLTPDRQLTVLGKALSLVESKYQEETFMLIELLTTGHLQPTPLHTQPRRPLLGTPTQCKRLFALSLPSYRGRHARHSNRGQFPLRQRDHSHLACGELALHDLPRGTELSLGFDLLHAKRVRITDSELSCFGCF
jgi:hypothetical protein